MALTFVQTIFGNHTWLLTAATLVSTMVLMIHLAQEKLSPSFCYSLV